MAKEADQLRQGHGLEPAPEKMVELLAWESVFVKWGPIGVGHTSYTVFDQILDWHKASPGVRRKLTNLRKGDTMQRQWTIEARADFADKAKNEAISEHIRELAVHLHAIMSLMDDGGQKSQVSCFSEDYFMGPQAIELHAAEKGDSMAQAVDSNSSIPAMTVSNEMLNALKGK